MSASQYIDTMSTSQYIDSILFNLPPVPVPTFFAAIDHTGAVPPATYPLHAIPVQDAPLPALPAPLPTPMPAPMQVVEAPTTKPRRKDPRTYKRFTNPGRKPAAPGKGRRRLANPPSACEMDPAEDLWVSFEGESSTCKFGAKVCDYSDAPDKIWDHIKKKHWPELTGTSNAEKKVQCLWGNCRQRLTADSLKNHVNLVHLGIRVQCVYCENSERRDSYLVHHGLARNCALNPRNIRTSLPAHPSPPSTMPPPPPVPPMPMPLPPLPMLMPLPPLPLPTPMPFPSPPMSPSAPADSPGVSRMSTVPRTSRGYSPYPLPASTTVPVPSISRYRRAHMSVHSMVVQAPIPAYPEPEFSLMPAVPVAGAGLATGSAAGEDFVSALHAAEQFLLGDAPQVDAAEVDFSDMFANEPFSLA